MEEQEAQSALAGREALDKWIEVATSPSHKWGQTIGDFLEQAVEKELYKFAQTHGLYLDQKGNRPARRGKKISWVDSYGNSHDLDFVLERGGTASRIGEPVAFIESAWRRYTKHSRNKAQEIQGAVLPLVARHKNLAPFIGAVLGGEFTNGALSQLKSLGFNVLYFPYDQVIKAFEKFGVDAAFEEDTSRKDLRSKIAAWKKFKRGQELSEYLLKVHSAETRQFFDNLSRAVVRYVNSVSVTPLHGLTAPFASVKEAISFINDYDIKSGKLPVLKYEIVIKYNNGDKVEATFADGTSATEFLNSYSAPAPKKD